MSLLSLVRRVSVTATRRMYATSTEAPPQRTALYDWHVRHGGKMVPFAGWEMPVQYKDSIMESHLHARASAALFDVSHMCQLFFHGADRESFLERVTVGNVKAMKEGTGCYSLITNTKGGVIDDTVFSKHADRVYMVVNAGCAEKDVAHLREQLADFTKNGAKDVRMERLSHLSLVALQGPKAAAVVARLTDTDLKHFAFLDSRPAVVAGIPAILTRCGYTGEDGFEISVATDKIEQLADALVSQPEVRPAGLGPRDSLRLEAALPLYGHDLNEDITPIEAGLAWAIAKRRRQEGGFLGADVILAQLNNGVARKRVGLVLDSGVCRENAPILSESGENIGLVTSGGFAPSLKKAIAMGYVKTAHSEIGTRLKVSVRDRQYAATVTKMPFVATSYYKPPK